MKKLSDIIERPSLFTTQLPGDELVPDPKDLPSDNFLRRSRPVHRASYTYVTPEHVEEPVLLAVSKRALEDLNIDDSETTSAEFVDILSGNKVVEDTYPWAQCYAGHQFGSWAGQLGDGRAISLFETVSSANVRYEIQLKGAGRTPYSRFADGYAVLRSSIREFLASEALASLNIPTTRALALLGTAREVYREDAPANTQQPERGAIVCRFAPSWLRFGSFEVFAARGDRANLQKLADYVCAHVIPISQSDERDFTYVVDGADGTADQKETTRLNKYALMFEQIMKKTSDMVARWQSLGFNHGVMNTDNMSILGLTLDFGPYAFLDRYDPEFICNDSDYTGRYAFNKQPTVCIWNLFRFSSTFFDLIGASPEDLVKGSETWDDERRKELFTKGSAIVQEMLKEGFQNDYQETYEQLMCAKLGILEKKSEDMETVVSPALTLLRRYGLDYHKFFRILSNSSRKDLNTKLIQDLTSTAMLSCDNVQAMENDIREWLSTYQKRLVDTDADDAQRIERMKRVNPRFVLRNWVAQDVISAFDQSEDEGKRKLQLALECCLHPYRDQYEDDIQENWCTAEVPEWGQNLICSCSS